MVQRRGAFARFLAAVNKPLRLAAVDHVEAIDGRAAGKRNVSHGCRLFATCNIRLQRNPLTRHNVCRHIIGYRRAA